MNHPTPTPAALKAESVNPQPSASLDRILIAAQTGRSVIQDFTPLPQSLEWELSQSYWEEKGSLAFTSDEVPFLINNDGQLSVNAAEVFFANLIEADREGSLERDIYALEIGIGIGLFARYFLDAFRRLCLEYGKDYYERFLYIAADRSNRMLRDVCEHGILSNHQKHYEFRVLNALRRFGATTTDAEHQFPNRVRAVFLNYVLDTLPATVLLVDESAVREMYIQTVVARGVEIGDHTNLTLKELVRCASSSDAAEKRQLLDLYHIFAVEYEYRLTDLSTLPYGKFASQFGQLHGPYILHNHGAIQCLENSLECLYEGGFVLFSDYGIGRSQDFNGDYQYQHFGASTAIGINFPLLKSYFENSLSMRWVEPDNDGSVHTRLLGRKLGLATTAKFQERFNKAVFDRANKPIERARQYLQDKHYEKAVVAYSEAITYQPQNWALIAEVSRFLTSTLRNYSAGLEMATRGLQLNPLCPDLWNTLGDSFFYLDRINEAHEAFLQALKLNPNGARARYNLIYTFARLNDHPSALKMIAEGLWHDKTGEYRDRFLQRQAELLDRLSQFGLHVNQYLGDRFSRHLGAAEAARTR